MSFSRATLCGLFWAGVLVAGITPASAQIQVGLELPRNLFVRYEPILATITIANLTGGPLLLQDANGNPWFSFQIEHDRGGIVPARIRGYSHEPVAIGPGEALRRTVNIMPIYQLDDFGRYRVRATIYDAQSGRFFSSRPVPMEITEGRVIWQRIVGHPLTGENRQVTLLAHRLPQSTAAYLRITDPDKNRVISMYRLGPLVTSAAPEMELDINNEVHILQMRAPRRFIYSHIGLDGEIRVRAAYEQTPRSKPSLSRGDTGEIVVAGGMLFNPEAQEAEDNIPTVTDRPVPLPGQQPPTAPAVPSQEPEPEEKPRGGINLWPFNR